MSTPSSDRSPMMSRILWLRGLIGETQAVINRPVRPKEEQVARRSMLTEALSQELLGFGFQQEGPAIGNLIDKTAWRKFNCVVLAGDRSFGPVVQEIAYRKALFVARM